MLSLIPTLKLILDFHLSLDCQENNEQAAAAVLGYTQQIWDNASGKEKQPASARKHWAQLTDAEKAAAMVLGYTGDTWDGKGGKKGKKHQPASAKKYWAELTSCGESPAVAQPLSGHICTCIYTHSNI